MATKPLSPLDVEHFAMTEEQLRIASNLVADVIRDALRDDADLAEETARRLAETAASAAVAGFEKLGASGDS